MAILSNIVFIGWQFWLVAFLVFLIVEAISVSLLSVWFMVGSVVALILSLVGASPAVQGIAFVVVSAICLLIFILIIKPRLNKKTEQKEKTNADRIINQEAIVLQTINPLENTGQIRVRGQVWSAASYNDLTIEKDVLVVVKEIKGVKAYVVPYNETDV